MQIIYLIFNEGHAASAGPNLTRTDLTDEAIRLARQLHERLPEQPETAGLLSLLLLTAARRSARSNEDGDLIPLDQQDRRLWNRPMITEGLMLLTAAFRRHAVGEYQLQAAIAAVHNQAPSYTDTDWPKIRALYDRLAQRQDNPLVRLNRAVAVAHCDGVEPALEQLEPLRVALADHHRFHATLGYLHDLAGNRGAAAAAYGLAARLATNDRERHYLEQKARP